MPEPSVPAVRIPSGGVASSPPFQQDRFHDIDQIGQRINGIIRFMCDIGNLPGISGEAREKALTAFHERLIAVEKQLAQIQERLRLE